jgi:hypothetical protein
MDFTSAHAKVARANDQLNALHGDMSRFFGDQPHPMGSKFNAETSDIDIYPFGYEGAPLLDWRLAIGDCLHNLRCGLDHTAWQFALDHLGRIPIEEEAKKIQFPISETSGGFAGSRIRPFISTDHWNWIDHFQPYHRPDPARTRLAMLAHLNNVDKHRVVHAAALVPDGAEFEIGELRNVESYESFELFLGKPIEPGAPIGHFRGVVPSGKNPYIDAQGPVEFRVVFADPSAPEYGESVTTVLSQFGELVDGIVSTSEAIFELGTMPLPPPPQHPTTPSTGRPASS